MDVVALVMRGSVGLLLGFGCLIGMPAAQAEPLVPLDNAEIQYLEQARRLLPLTDDPIAFSNDGELLVKGRLACYRRDSSRQVGYQGTFVPAVLTQLAFIYLCPQ
jgi:hypothetical protein